MTEPPASVAILDSAWPGRPLPVMPGDLSQWLPQGLGLGAPMIVTPYSLGAEPSFYGLDAPSPDPVLAAPTQIPGGGLLYFDDKADPAKLRGALDILGVYMTLEDYAVFAASAEDTVAERYLDQVRIVSKSALAHFFKAGTEAGNLPEQPIPLGDYILAFVVEQKGKWNDEYTFSQHLRGTLGGDGDWAKESLAFGFVVENTYWGVYRVWSRPWLCTK
jgi:hypothetical protein